MPKLSVGFRDSSILAILVAVPKAAVDKNGGLILRKNDVGLAWHILSM